MWLLLAGSRSLQDWRAVETFHATDEFLRSKFVEGNPLDRNVLTGLLFLGLIVLVKRRQEVGRLLWRNWPIVLFLGYCAVSTLWSDYPDVAFKRWTKGFGDFVMVTIVLTDAQPAAALQRFLARPAFVLVPVSALLIKYYPRLGQRYNPWDGTQTFIGAAPDKNMLGLTCLVVGFAAVWRVVHALPDRRLRPIVAHGAIVAMVLWLFWKADSMTSLSCFMMATLLMVLTLVPVLGKKRVVVHAAVLALLSVAFAALFLHIGSGMVESMGRDPTITGRTELWDELRQMNPNVVFGAGFESFWLGDRLQHLWDTFAWKPNEAHNGYLEVFLNLGSVGVILLTLVIVTGYRNALRTFAVDREGGRLRLGYILIGLAYSFTEAGFRMMNPVWVAFMMSAIAMPSSVVASIANDPFGVSRTPGPRPLAVVRAAGPDRRRRTTGVVAGSSVGTRRPSQETGSHKDNYGPRQNERGSIGGRRA